MTLETCGSKRLLKSYVKIDKRRDKKNLPCDFYPTRCVFSKTHNSLDKIISKCKPGGILYISFDALHWNSFHVYFISQQCRFNHRIDFYHKQKLRSTLWRKMRHSGQHVSSAVQHLVQCQHIFGPLRKHVESDRLVYSIELLRRKCIKVKQTYLFTRCEKFLVSNLLNIIVFQIAFVVRLFVCLEFSVPIENVSLIWRRHHCRWRAANFDLCSALMAIEQWGFFSVSHILWHGASVYNCHPEDLWHWHWHLVQSVWQWGCHYLF